VAVDTSGRIYDDFSRLLFLHAHREASALANELQEESEQFRFLRAASYANIKGSVGLILTKTSVMRISIPLDLSSRSFIPLPRFMRSRRAAPLLVSRAGGSPRLKISSVNDVDCRGSRRATMNQTQHQRWTYRSAGLQALIQSTAHNKNAGSSCAVEATAWSGLSGESSIARERERTCF
jgi:hypothetical protein